MRRLAALLAIPAAVAASVAVVGSVAEAPPARAQTPAVQIGRVQKASFVAPVRGKDPLVVLALGSDARPGVCMPVERCLADSIHLITVNRDEGGATILGFPRDSYVNIPGFGQARINEALHDGGPELVVRTVEELTGIPIDYYLLTSFEGLPRMVKEIGGLEVNVPYPMNDESSGAVFDEGPQVLQGQEVLAFSRNRKDTPNGDFSRSENQGAVLLGALEQLHRQFRQNPAALFTWIIAGAQNMQTDLSFGELFDLGLTALAVKPDRVQNLVVPGGIGTAGTASIVVLSESAEELYRDLEDDGLIG
jgi:polyisoprenyl-teichoic acid--peptidoglycan teichoic acid transferase